MPSEPFHRLFFAVRPPLEVVPEIAALRDGFGQAKGPVTDEHLHLTTWLFPDSQNIAADQAERAKAAIAALPLVRFRVALDRMVGSGSHVVMLPSEPLAGFVAFQGRLDAALRAAGLSAGPGWRFNPHVTLLYGRHAADEWITPISWEVEQIFLLDSVVGERRHDVIACWPLG